MNKETTEYQLQLRLRKNQSDLAAIGLGVIAFGVWSVIKTVLGVALDPENYLASFEGDRYMLLAFWIILGGALAIDLALRLFIGRSAIAEGKGKKRRAGYIVLALLMAVLSFVLLTVGLILQGTSSFTGTAVVTMVVELTSDVLLLEMCISAIRIRRIKRKMTGAES